MKKFVPDNLQVGGKTLRPQQVEVLRWLESLPKNTKAIAMVCPTGSGKTLISQAIQQATGGSYIAPSNVLVDQYVTETGVTPIYGKNVYQVEELEDHSKTDLQELAHKAAMNRLANGDGYFSFNPISFTMHQKKMPKNYSKDMVIDEAHKITSLISLQATQTVAVPNKLPLPAVITEMTIVPWLKQVVRLVYGPEKDKINEVLDVYQHQPEIMSFEVNASRTAVMFTPVIPPIHLLKRLFTSGTKYLLSATLPKRLIPYLIPGINLDDIQMLELPSDFPVENRKVRYSPVPFREDSESDWAPKVVPRLAELIVKHGKPNTLIHVPYKNAANIARLLQNELPDINIVCYTKESKKQAIEYWKEHGGVLLGCGISEGVDFPGDICRLNIVPKIILADMGALAVRKRKSIEGGEELYYLSALVDLIQAFGRGVRSKDDWCVNVVLDPIFPRLLAKYHKDLPKSFIEAVDLSTPKD